MAEKLKVLFIDDDEDDFLIVEDLLSEKKLQRFELIWEPDGSKAQDLLASNEFDAILLDYRLGALSGFDIIKKFNPLNLSGPVILLTGQEDDELDKVATKAGFADYLVKADLKADLLERSLRYNIEQFKNLKEIRELNKNLEKKVKDRTFELNDAVKKLKENNKNLRQEIKRRKETENALYESQLMYNAITSNFPKGSINVFNRKYVYIFSDGRDLKEIGVDKKFIRGVKLLDFLPEKEGEIFTKNLDRVFEGKNVSFEIPLNNRCFKIHGVPLPNKENEIENIMVVAQNITEQKESEEKIKKSLEKERELNELKTRFVSMASHEFRTPLATILSSTSLVDKYRKTQKFEGIEKHTNKIRNNVVHLTQILNDFLSFGRLEEGKVNYNPELINVIELVEETVEDLQEIAKKGQEIELYSNLDKIMIPIDPQVLKNVLYNLISNASKYSSENSHIIVKVIDSDKDLMLSVQDFGMGIPDKEQKLLFDRFFRASNASNIQGTGLGLNIVKKYVDLMGGTINFTSRFNEGTTFVINVPK